MAGRGRRWVLLCYRMPREPSSPRVAVWRRLRRLGVAQLGDGVVALPADARTQEQLEWVAEEVAQAGGSATVWLADAGSEAQSRELADAMSTARAREYTVLAEKAAAAIAQQEGPRVLRRLRGELRQIGRRDFFPPAERERARRAVDELAASLVTDVTHDHGEVRS